MISYTAAMFAALLTAMGGAGIGFFVGVLMAGQKRRGPSR